VINVTDLSTLNEIKERLNTQDNRATANPIFVVYDWEKVPCPEGYTDDCVYLHDGDEIGTTKEEVIKFCKENDIKLPDDIEEMDYWNFDSWIGDQEELTKWYYQKVRRFVNVFFTEEAAQRFFDANHYHYSEPHIYVNSLWRNPEMQAVRKALMEGRFVEGDGE